MYYFKNKLKARNVKGKVRNAYRAYKLLYYTVLDAMCCHLFLCEFNPTNFDDVIPLPDDFTELSPELRSDWLNEICRRVLRKHFFNNTDDLFKKLREILNDPNHPENYWISNMNDGRIKCHFCERTRM